MKTHKPLTGIAILTAIMTVSPANAEGYNRSGNYVSNNGTVVITNTRSSYDMGDVIIKKNSNTTINAGNYTYKQAGDEVVKIRNEDNWTVGTIDFDRNNNVDLNSSILEPTDNGCGVTHRCGDTPQIIVKPVSKRPVNIRPVNLR